MHTRYPLSIHFQNAQKWLSSNCEKKNDNNLRIISNRYAYLQSMATISVKFQENRY